METGRLISFILKTEYLNRHSFIGVLRCVAPPEMRVSALAGKEMGSIENKFSARPLFCSVVILSIFVAGSLFTGTPLVYAQSADPTTTDERLENIEELLVELSEAQYNMQMELGEDLKNIHSSYLTKQIFETEMKFYNTELSSKINELKIEMSALDETIGTQISSLKFISYFQTALLMLLLSPYIVPPVLKKIKDR